MSKRVFDESQLRKTIVTMIDKYGFNKKITMTDHIYVALKEIDEVLYEFNESDFSDEPTVNGDYAFYTASTPVSEEQLSRLISMFQDEPDFNVEIDGKVYNSVKDNFNYNASFRAISLDGVFTISVMGENLDTFVFDVYDTSAKPHHAKVYNEKIVTIET